MTEDAMAPAIRRLVAAVGLLACLVAAPGAVAATDQGAPGTPAMSGAEIYRRACAHCHGPDGRGVVAARQSLPVPLPDFTDCQFAPREPDGDWLAVIHEGGPARAFDRIMPAFGRALSADEAQRALDHVRTFCASRAWPRGELNLPKALVTEKAFPEDEWIWITAFDVEGEGSVTDKFVYEKRFGPRNQIELVLPIVAHDRSPGSWHGGIGDVAVGFKRAVYHSRERGSIFSVTGEMKLPTGDAAKGFGKGVAVFEPSSPSARCCPRRASCSSRRASSFHWRPTVRATRSGVAWSARPSRKASRAGPGRRWSRSSAPVSWSRARRWQWDVLPELQISLSTRQHVLFNVGVRVPLTDAGQRSTQLLAYVLWDWFDGGLFAGW